MQKRENQEREVPHSHLCSIDICTKYIQKWSYAEK